MSGPRAGTGGAKDGRGLTSGGRGMGRGQVQKGGGSLGGDRGRGTLIFGQSILCISHAYRMVGAQLMGRVKSPLRGRDGCFSRSDFDSQGLRALSLLVDRLKMGLVAGKALLTSLKD